MKRISTLNDLRFDLEQEAHAEFKTLTRILLTMSTAGFTFLLAFQSRFTPNNLAAQFAIWICWCALPVSTLAGLALQHKFVLNPLLRMRHAEQIASTADRRKGEGTNESPLLSPSPSTTLDDVLYWTQLLSFLISFLSLMVFKWIN